MYILSYYKIASFQVTSSRPYLYSEFIDIVHPKKAFFRLKKNKLYLRTLTVLSACITSSHCRVLYLKQSKKIGLSDFSEMMPFVPFFFLSFFFHFFSFFLVNGKSHLNKLLYIFLKRKIRIIQLNYSTTDIGKVNKIIWSYRNIFIYIV